MTQLEQTSLMQQLNFAKHLPDADLEKIKTAIKKLLMETVIPNKETLPGDDDFERGDTSGWNAYRQELIRRIESL